jgi:hypothetical protein
MDHTCGIWERKVRRCQLPPEARLYIIKQQDGSRQVVAGVSPEFAMTKMDEELHPECDVYVEDARAETLVNEILVEHRPALWERCLGIPYGSAQVGHALGQMAAGNRFPRPTCCGRSASKACQIVQSISSGCLCALA